MRRATCFSDLADFEESELLPLVGAASHRTLGLALWAASDEVRERFRQHLPEATWTYVDEESRFQGQLADRYLPDSEEELPVLASFEDLVQLTDREIQTVLREIDQQDVATALTGAGKEIQERILTNTSEAVRRSIEGTMQSQGDIPRGEVARARQGFLDAVTEVGPQAVEEARKVVREAMVAQEQIVELWRSRAEARGEGRVPGSSCA